MVRGIKAFRDTIHTLSKKTPKMFTYWAGQRISRRYVGFCINGDSALTKCWEAIKASRVNGVAKRGGYKCRN